jgi:hypothetical protein
MSEDRGQITEARRQWPDVSAGAGLKSGQFNRKRNCEKANIE